MASSTMTIRLPTEVKRQLEQLAKVTDRSKSWLAADAIRSYLEIQQWQIDEIMAGIKEADAGDFADAAEVEAVFNKWTKNEN